MVCFLVVYKLLSKSICLIIRCNTTAHQQRWTEVENAINEKGTYELTTCELTFGAKSAWRNAARCIGRIQWSKLQVIPIRLN